MRQHRKKNGASEGTRTLDIHLGKVTLYQLSYARTRNLAGNLGKIAGSSNTYFDDV